MSHHVAVCGMATPTGLYARCGDGWRKLEPTRTPIAAMELCPCGREDCDCDEWPEIMRTAPFEDAAENKPVFTWADENLGGEWTATGRLHFRWQQSETDWIRTGC